jgi:hypothetical protein
LGVAEKKMAMMEMNRTWAIILKYQNCHLETGLRLVGFFWFVKKTARFGVKTPRRHRSRLRRYAVPERAGDIL